MNAGQFEKKSCRVYLIHINCAIIKFHNSTWNYIALDKWFMADTFDIYFRSLFTHTKNKSKEIFTCFFSLAPCRHIFAHDDILRPTLAICIISSYSIVYWSSVNIDVGKIILLNGRKMANHSQSRMLQKTFEIFSWLMETQTIHWIGF